MNSIDIAIKHLNFGSTYDEVAQAMEDLENEMLLLSKRIKILFIDLYRSLPDRLGKSLKKLSVLLTDAFRIETLDDYTQAAAIYGAELAGSLYQLQISLTGLKAAVIQAAAPIVQVLLPVVQTAIRALTGLAQSIGYVFRMLFLGTAEVETYAQETQTAVTATKSLKRSLAGFDQINRLADNKSSGGGSVIGGIFDVEKAEPLGGAWKKLGDKLLELLEPLKKIDLSPAAKSLERLVEALKPITRALFDGLEWAWYNIFVPLAQWAVEELLPVFLDTLAVALENLAVIIEELKPHFLWLWENCLKPWAEWKADQLIGQMQSFQNQLNGVGEWAGSNQSLVEQMIASGKQLALSIGLFTQEAIGVTEISDKMNESFGNTLWHLAAAATPFHTAINSTSLLSYALGSLADAFFRVGSASDSTWNTVSSIARTGWGQLKSLFIDPFTTGIKQSFNGVVSVMNGTLSGMETVVNSASKAINSLGFTIPSWIPKYGGKSFNFGLGTVSLPSIPWLAKGAVLPANKPFMAVVGDQRHGTNVEAPLTVIQDAVATVMGDYAAGNMAGHQATVAVLQELLAAVLGISIGDDVIAGAVQRYERKTAVMRGGL